MVITQTHQDLLYFWMSINFLIIIKQAAVYVQILLSLILSRWFNSGRLTSQSQLQPINISWERHLLSSVWSNQRHICPISAAALPARAFPCRHMERQGAPRTKPYSQILITAHGKHDPSVSPLWKRVVSFYGGFSLKILPWCPSNRDMI